jgi:GNAT superfamily N-acetyltransferase
MARVPLSLRPFALEDLTWLFPADEASGADERADIAWRLRMVERGALVSHCFVAVDESSGRPCHVQWITEAGYDAAIRRGGALPVLGPDQAMLENAYTPPRYRGMGVMAAVTAMMAERAGDVGARSVVAFVDEDNVASLKGAFRAGFRPYTVRVRRQYAFGLIRTARFSPVPADLAFPVESPGGDGRERA